MGGISLAGAAFLFLLFGNGSHSGQPAWTQPPVQVGEANAQPVYQGWNVVSVHNTQWHAADDWQSTDTIPITGVNWWGSYVSWSQNSLPPVAPTGFWLGIYDNAPAGNGVNYGRPGNLIWSYTTSSFTQDFVGYDSLDDGVLDSAFRYSVELPESAWFTPQGNGTTNWLSIAAVYPGDVPPVYQWGWKTRSEVNGEDAVWLVGDPPDWVPLQWNGQGWDTAFELTTTGPDPVIPECGSLGLIAIASGLISMVRLSRYMRCRSGC